LLQEDTVFYQYRTGAADCLFAIYLYSHLNQFRIAVQVALTDVQEPSAAAVLLCPAPSAHFTGRTQVLDTLDKIFLNTGRRIATLVTHGGAGKTQIALKFAADHSPKCVLCR
jgi:hypothetical protein